jgi:pimeloyl-ACP methyl ester carboxylesterase
VLLIEPQFLERVDVKANHLPADLPYWQRAGWESGQDAASGAKISSFSVVDAILAALANRDLFPHLRDVVIAGHSGGGQMVQRYAVLGRGEQAFGAAGVHVRYVVANPSSYVYFTAARPSAGDCAGYDDWKYGLNNLPPYGADSEKAALETRYAGRDVRYLLGTADIDPNHPALDKSCMAERQGPDRYARGTAYFRYLRRRHHGQFAQQLFPVADIGHDARKMFTAACGLSAVYDVPGCAAK